jgi:hypothetical protein
MCASTIVSPKVFVGASYSGSRTPFLADMLRSDPVTRFDALILVSPAFYLSHTCFEFKVARLPTIASIVAERSYRLSEKQHPRTFGCLPDDQRQRVANVLSDCNRNHHPATARDQRTRRSGRMTGARGRDHPTCAASRRHASGNGVGEQPAHAR